LEPGEGPIDGALRELDEEIGVGQGRDAVLGRLDDYITRAGYLITPIVCWNDCEDPISPNPEEVASVHFVALPGLLGVPRVVWPPSPRPVLHLPLLGSLIQAPTGALPYQFAEVALRGRHTRVDDLTEPSVSGG
jgi:8-oxo-dGTP pyrophosphatase MutT (NUDIX family)